MKRTTTMKLAVENILKNFNIFEEFFNSAKLAVKIKSEGYLPLTIEKQGNRIAVTHYFEQNGDLVPNPDMEFVDLGSRGWLPVAIQHSNGIYVRAAFLEEGEWKCYPKRLKDLESFSKLWARNLLSQGFAQGTIERIL